MPIQDEVHKANIALAELKSEVTAIKDSLTKLVTRHEFDPVKLIVYGLCACILTGVIASILGRVIIK